MNTTLYRQRCGQTIRVIFKIVADDLLTDRIRKPNAVMLPEGDWRVAASWMH